MGDYTYLFLDLISISIPLLWSFEKKVRFYQKWKALWSAIFITGIFFVLWDILFTQWGIWGFNPDYLLGIEVFNLPLEELLFFVCIPYACVFTYEALSHYIRKDILRPYAKAISLVLIITLSLLAILFTDKWYTSVTFFLTGLFLFLHLTVWKTHKKYLGRFYLSYAVILIPFFIINGVLTGTGIEDQVVWYDNAENLSVRLGTIPIEDSIYGMLLILMNVTIYEKLKTIA